MLLNIYNTLVAMNYFVFKYKHDLHRRFDVLVKLVILLLFVYLLKISKVVADLLNLRVYIGHRWW